MLSKLSVKKPYTVWVGVAMIIILGVVSVLNMVTDLLPSMNMPYSVVYTTYIGASSQEVEETVTRPVESAMATVSNIKNMQSVSSDNLSLVILEFEDDANMDSVTIEMRENLDQISSSWDDGIGSPVIMNINPDMVPVMIAAVDMEGLSGAELYDYVNNNIISQLESIEGVASVTASGGVVESIQVTLNEEKMEEANVAIRKALAKKFTEARDELIDARKQIEDGLTEIDSASEEITAAKEKINTSLKELTSQLADAKNQTDSKQLEIIQTKIDLNEKLSDLLTQKASLEENRAALVTGLDPEPMAAQIAQLDAALEQVNSGIETLNSTMTQLEAGSTQLDEAKKQIELQETDATLQLYTALIEANTGSAKLDDTKAGLEDSLKEIEDAETQIDDSEQAAYDAADLTAIVTVDLVKSILTAQNFSMPAGYAAGDGEDTIMVKVGDKIGDADELTDLVLMDMGLDDVEPIRLSDVADVEIVDNSDSIYATINGKDGILLTFEKQTGYSTGDVSDTIQETFEELSEETEGLDFAVLMDQGIYIDYIVGSVFSNLLWGALFAIIILAFFLKSVKPTLTIAVSIPVSLLAAIAAMYFTGININIISLSGLALSVGMLVDNSIVVIENIYRLRGEGVPLYKACVKGAKEVAGAIFASTLTTCCVFLPIVFTEGITKSLFVDLGLTVTYSLMASLLIALTLVPAMSAGILKNVPEKPSKLVNAMQNFYYKSIKFMLKRKALVLIFAVLVLAGSAFGAYMNGTSFMPSMETTQMSITMTVPEEYSFSEATDISSKVVEQIMTIDGVETVGAMTGGSSLSSLTSSSSSEGTSITIYVILNEDKELSNTEIKNQILEKTADLDCQLDISSDISEMTMMFGSGVSVKITGRDLDKLREIAADFATKLESVEGLIDIDNGLGETAYEYRVSVDKSEASKYNLTVAQVYLQVAAEVAGDSTATTLETDTKDIDVVVGDGSNETTSIEDIKNLEITYTDSQGESGSVKLSEIAAFDLAETMASITRYNQVRTVTVKGSLDDGYNVGLVGNDVQDIIDDYEIPSGYSITLSGQNETITDALEQLMLMLLLGVIFVYLVMVAQFQSLKMPFIIMFTIPLAFTGGFLGLIIADLDLSVISMLGFILLTGVIVNNGIVLVDYINQLRLSGTEKHEAIAEAGRTRLRPILMTAITTILGLLTMAFGVGMGADMVQPIAVVTIGGMIYGTLMTLWIVPCIYDIFAGKKELENREVE